MLKIIEGNPRWSRVEPVTKGFSADKKYHVWDQSGGEYLLRISHDKLFRQKWEQFALLRQLARQDIPASRPVEFGRIDEEHIYLLLSWIRGVDAETHIACADSEVAYELGLRGGEILRKIHAVEIKTSEESWDVRYQKMVDQRIKDFKNCPLDLPQKDVYLSYVEKNRDVVHNRPTVLMHGDYHRGNMVVMPEGGLGIIDFDKVKTGDPYRDFKCFAWNVQVSPYFASGIIDGYFNHQIASDFFPIMTLYAAEGMMRFVNWAIPYGKGEIKIALQQYQDMLVWFDGFRRTVPAWYVGDGL